jgi:hypothetical protein
MDMSNHALLRPAILVLLASLATACQSTGAARFDRLLVDDAIAGGYGVEAADIDGDGLRDIVALATTPAQFVWYRNPDWEKYTISTATSGNIATAPHDVDGDGDVDLVLASEFSLSNSTSGGLVQWFENPGNPRDQQAWQAHRIDAIPTAHRVRWADVQGDGRHELLVLPIIGIGAAAPDYAAGAQLTAYAVPADPRGVWPKVILSDTLEMAHGLQIEDWDADGRQDFLTASFAGIELLQLGYDGLFVSQVLLGEGNRGTRPGQGSSEVAVGVLDGERFLASIEPWHGNEVVIYQASGEQDQPWLRQVIDAEFRGGHALLTADLNNDGQDEILAGFRSEPYGLHAYRYLRDTGLWERTSLNASRVAVSGLIVEDFTGDGFKDVVAIGSASANLVLFVNEGR